MGTSLRTASGPRAGDLRPCPDAGAVLPEDLAEYVRCYSQPGAMRCGFEYYRTFNDSTGLLQCMQDVVTRDLLEAVVVGVRIVVADVWETIDQVCV